MSDLERLQAEYDRINSRVKKLRDRQDQIDLEMTAILAEQEAKP